jgi:hypothetical protein
MASTEQVDAGARLSSVGATFGPSSMLSARHVLSRRAAVILNDAGPFRIVLQVCNLLACADGKEEDTSERSQRQ